MKQKIIIWFIISLLLITSCNKSTELEKNTTNNNENFIFKQNEYEKFISSDKVKIDENLLKEIESLYKFHPQVFNEEELTVISDKLDFFWSKVENNKDKLLPWLRYALLNIKDYEFFLFDGSMLLLSLSQEKYDHYIAIKSMAKTDIKDLQIPEYLKIVWELGCKGYDISEPIYNTLKYTEITAFFPQHFLTLNHEDIMTFLVFSQENTQNTIYGLNSILIKETKPEIIKSILYLLSLDWSEYSFSKINEYINWNPQSDEVKKFIKEHKENLLKTKHNSTPKTKDLIKKRQQLICKTISDAVLEEFFKLTNSLNK